MHKGRDKGRRKEKEIYSGENGPVKTRRKVLKQKELFPKEALTLNRIEAERRNENKDAEKVLFGKKDFPGNLGGTNSFALTFILDLHKRARGIL